MSLIRRFSTKFGRGHPSAEYGPVPEFVDRIVVHQFDPARPAPGGIDTCLRGIVRHIPQGSTFAFVGVDAGGGHQPERRLGHWEKHHRGSETFYFMPVVKLDRGNQKRKIPHSFRLVMGAIRFLRRMPETEWFQAHRLEAAWSLRHLLGSRTAYFIHTQEDGLTGETSDSFWRLAPSAHKRLERSVIQKAAQVVVFNEDYAEVAREWNPRTQASTTWFDPELIVTNDLPTRDDRTIIWVGRLEVPKDPLLAIQAFNALVENSPAESWRLDMVGSGTRSEGVHLEVKRLPPDVRNRIQLHGRTPHARVAELMAQAGVFLMTSHPGYEGYPRVLVEALASGLPAVVTEGSDTGRLIRNAQNGFVTSRDPAEIADRLREAISLPRSVARASVVHLSAPQVISRIYAVNER